MPGAITRSWVSDNPSSMATTGDVSGRSPTGVVPSLRDDRGDDAGRWRGFAIRDGNPITGQRNFSGRETAQAVMAALGE